MPKEMLRTTLNAINNKIKFLAIIELVNGAGDDEVVMVKDQFGRAASTKGQLRLRRRVKTIPKKAQPSPFITSPKPIQTLLPSP
jgi:hypothetical protein